MFLSQLLRMAKTWLAHMDVDSYEIRLRGMFPLSLPTEE